MKAVCLLPIIPVRTSPCEQSEQCTQLLFGELVEIFSSDEKWCSVRNEADGYEGFVSKNMLTQISDDDYEHLRHAPRTILSKPMLQVCKVASDETMFLPMGSLLYDCAQTQFSVLGQTYEFADPIPVYDLKDLGFVARQMLSAPYLWGGKTLMGIDCSGLVQVVADVCGCQLPRDASQQVAVGETVCFLAEAQSGDLAFFENTEGRIVHVGLLVDNQHIVHASGSVKISRIDDYGILSETGGYSHKLRIIKRIKC